MSAGRVPDQRERRSDDERDLADLLSAWRAGKLLVKVILIAGSLVITVVAAVTSWKVFFGIGPHP
jgi:hypothetical protein